MAKNNIPVEDVADEEVVTETPAKGGLSAADAAATSPGATVKVGAAKGSNLSIPGAASMDEAQTLAILERLQKFVDEKDSNKGIINPLMKGLNLGYATTYGPEQFQKTAAGYDLQDKEVQNTLNTMGGLASTMASNKAFMSAANAPQGGGQAADGTMPVQGAPGAPGAAPVAPIDKIIASLPGPLQEKALIYKKMGTRAGYEEIMKMAGEYENKGRTGESKNYAEIMAMPEGPLKQMRLKQLLDKAYEPITTYKDGVEFKESGPGAGYTPGAATAPSAPAGGTNLGNMRPPGQSTGFQAPTTPDKDLARMDNNLKGYGDQGVDTLAKVISKWSPPNENDTPALINNAAKFLGIDPNQKIDLSNPAVRHAITTAIIKQEGNLPKVFKAPSAPAGTSVPGLPAGSPASAKYSAEQFAEQNKMDREAILKPLRERQVKDEMLPSEIDKTLEIVKKGKFGPGTGLRQFALESKGLFSNLSKSELNELTNTRTLESTSRKLILADAKGSLPGSFSDSDRTYIDKTGASINDPKEFITATLQLKKASVLANRDLADYLSKPENSGRIAEAMQEYRSSGRGMQILKENAPTLFKYAKGEPGGKAAAPSAASNLSDDAARAWLAKNPNHPSAKKVKASLGE